jgi:type I restriction enzyme S subunit
MGGEWPLSRFADLCEHSAFGPRFSSDEYAPGGNVACLRTTDVDSSGRINLATMPLARLDLARFRNHLLQRGDLIITRTGAYLGKAAVFEDFRLPVLPGAFSIRFRIKRSVADPYFLRYYFNSQEGQAAITSIRTGSAQPNVNIPNLHSLRIPVPPLTLQKAIVGVLAALDDKIELNRRMNETLEAMARALFKSWFVDFDPVRAKAEGRHHLTEAKCVVPARTVMDAAHQLRASLLEQRIALSLESRHLARLRDELLPRLLSGALSVTHAERAVSEVA